MRRAAARSSRTAVRARRQRPAGEPSAAERAIRWSTTRATAQALGRTRAW